MSPKALSAVEIENLKIRLSSSYQDSRILNSINNRAGVVNEISKGNMFRRTNPPLNFDIAINSRSEPLTTQWMNESDITTWNDLIHSKDWFYAAVLEDGFYKQYMFLFPEGILWTSFFTDRSSNIILVCLKLNYNRCCIHDMDSDFDLFDPMLDKTNEAAISPDATIYTDSLDFSFSDEFPVELTAHLKYEIKDVSDGFVAGVLSWSNDLFRAELKLSTLDARNDLQSLQNQLIKHYSNGKNGGLIVTECDVYITALKKHQEEIQEIDPKFILNFVKLQKYFDEQCATLNVVYKYLEQYKIEGVETEIQLNNWTSLEGTFSKMCAVYSALQFDGVQMINSLITNDMLTFYEVYTTLDDFSIWDSRYEKDVLSQLKNINDYLNTINRTLENQTQSILSSIERVTDRLIEQTEKISETRDAIQANNLITAISAYQLYKINKNTKSLNS